MEVPDPQIDRVFERVCLEMQRPILQQPNLPEWGALGMGPHLSIGVAAKIGTDWQDTEERPLPGQTALEAAVESLGSPMEIDDEDDWDELRRQV